MTDINLIPQGDLLPPWKQYPEIERFSIGWRMGYGEDYIVTWGRWSRILTVEQRIEYFKKYLPIPFEWLDWVAHCCGHENHDYSEAGIFADVQWLEQYELANSAEFLSWHKRDFSRNGYLSSLRTISPNLVIPSATYDIINKLYSIMVTATGVKELTDKRLDNQEIKDFMTKIDRISWEIIFIVNALQIYQEHPDR